MARRVPGVPNTMKIQTLLALAGLLASFAAYADTVVLLNGDRLSGRVVSLEAGKLVFATAYAGELKLPWDQIRNLESDGKVRVQLADGTLLNGQLLTAPDGRARVKVSELVETAPIPIAQVTALNPPMGGDKVKLTGRANLGGTFSRGNTEEDTLHADAEMVARTASNRYTVGGEVNEASTQRVTTASNWRLNMKYDHFFKDKSYFYTVGLFERDTQADLDMRTSLGFGAGRQIFEEERRNLSLEGGLSFVNEDYGTAADQSFPGLRAALKYDQLFWDDKFKFFHTSELLASIDDSADYLLKTRTGVRIPVGKSLNLSTQVNLDYDNLPAPGKDTTDSALLFSVGYGF